VTMRVFLGIGRVANTPQPWIFERRFSIKDFGILGFMFSVFGFRFVVFGFRQVFWFA
jgi:hypothetical protein